MKTRQIEGEPRRIWFTDDKFDLYVWYEPDGALFGFQLCYDKEGTERAVTWLRSGVLRHTRVDSGDHHPLGNASPILTATCPIEPAAIRREFLERAGGLPAEVRDLVLGKLAEFPAAEIA
jgi:hypothetical protein